MNLSMWSPRPSFYWDFWEGIFWVSELPPMILFTSLAESCEKDMGFYQFYCQNCGKKHWLNLLLSEFPYQSEYYVLIRLLSESPVPVRLLSESPVRVRLLSESPFPVRLLSESPVPVRLLSESPVPVRLLSKSPVPVRLLSESPVYNLVICISQSVMYQSDPCQNPDFQNLLYHSNPGLSESPVLVRPLSESHVLVRPLSESY